MGYIFGKTVTHKDIQGHTQTHIYNIDHIFIRMKVKHLTFISPLRASYGGSFARIE